MKCPNDQTEMEQGFIDTAHWLSGAKPITKILGIGRKGFFVVAWRCPKCGKVELYSEK